MAMRAQDACEFCTDKGTKTSENYCFALPKKKTTHEDIKQNKIIHNPKGSYKFDDN